MEPCYKKNKNKVESLITGYWLHEMKFYFIGLNYKLLSLVFTTLTSQTIKNKYYQRIFNHQLSSSSLQEMNYLLNISFVIIFLANQSYAILCIGNIPIF